MIKKNTIFDFLTHTMVIWGISVLSLCLFCFLFGESAREMSSIFELGNVGVPLKTLVQFLMLSVVITALRWIFFTDVLIKQLSTILRSIFMFSGVIISVGIAAAVFKWFPVNQLMPWIMFLLSFLICTVISIGVSMLKEKSENRKLEDALERMKSEDF